MRENCPKCGEPAGVWNDAPMIPVLCYKCHMIWMTSQERHFIMHEWQRFLDKKVQVVVDAPVIEGQFSVIDGG